MVVFRGEWEENIGKRMPKTVNRKTNVKVNGRLMAVGVNEKDELKRAS